jgi:hypothetical protein
MITIATAVEELVRGAPFLEEGLAAGLLNLSALARRLRPQLERELHKQVGEAAVMMALRRLAPQVAARHAGLVDLLRRMRDLTVRSNLVEFTFRISPTTLQGQRELLHAVAAQRDVFLTITRGVYEVTLIASSSIEKQIESAFRDEALVSRLSDLSAIILALPVDSVTVPGVHYALLKQLAFLGLNVVEVVSTYSELTLVLAKADVDRAFSALKRFLWP